MLLKITSTVSIIFQEDGDEENPFGDEVGKNVTSFKEIPWVPKKNQKFFLVFCLGIPKMRHLVAFIIAVSVSPPKC